MRAAFFATIAVALAVLAAPLRAQPAPGGGSGTTQRIDLQPGQPVMQPVQRGNDPPTAPVRVNPGAAPGGVKTLPPGTRPLPGTASAVREYRPPDHGDIRSAAGADNKLMAVAFWLFALIAVGGAIFVITRRNLIAAVMGMVGSFFGVAAVYMMLYASFLGVVQMLVYAGAIMVLFVFVIMILNKPEDEPWGQVGLLGKGIAGLGMAYLAYRLVSLMWSVAPLKTSAAAPGVIHVAVGRGSADYAWGSTRAVGNTLFGSYLFPFEAVSILLLIAVVGAIAVARPLKDDDGVPPPEGAP